MEYLDKFSIFSPFSPEKIICYNYFSILNKWHFENFNIYENNIINCGSFHGIYGISYLCSLGFFFFWGRVGAGGVFFFQVKPAPSFFSPPLLIA
jgi:hypothetical protein